MTVFFSVISSAAGQMGHLVGQIARYRRAVIFKQSMEARDRVGIGLSYRPARLQRLAELIPLIDSWAP